MLRHFARLGFKPVQNKRILFTAATGLQHKRFASSGIYVNSPKNKFCQIGLEKDAGALQDLLRRVMEIDADITKTPVVDFKPNTQTCTAYCLADEFSLDDMSKDISFDDFFVSHVYDDMLHISNRLSGGDIYMFSNGTLTFWGFDQTSQDKMLDTIRQQQQCTLDFKESREILEYAVDEDELTDIKGDIMLLNPYTPSVNLSKIAFSYGLGRAAKLTSIEHSIKNYLSDIDNIPAQLCDPSYTRDASSYRLLVGKSLLIQQRMVKGSRDGLLGTSDFYWAKRELEGYVNKISDKFNVYTRIAIINKQLEYAQNVVAAAKEH